MRAAAVVALSVVLAHGGVQLNKAPVPVPGAAKYSLQITATEVSSPHQVTNVSWSGISEAGSGDWIAVCCDQVDELHACLALHVSTLSAALY
jgi:hypothetical protein